MHPRKSRLACGCKSGLAPSPSQVRTCPKVASLDFCGARWVGMVRHWWICCGPWFEHGSGGDPVSTWDLGWNLFRPWTLCGPFSESDPVWALLDPDRAFPQRSNARLHAHTASFSWTEASPAPRHGEPHALATPRASGRVLGCTNRKAPYELTVSASWLGGAACWCHLGTCGSQRSLSSERQRTCFPHVHAPQRLGK